MTSLAIGLSKQISEGKFEFLEEQLGNDLINAIPTIMLPEGYVDGDYPQPWGTPQEMPADVVKGIFPSRRPFLAMRYINRRTQTLAMEIFFQRYNSNVPCAARSFGISADSKLVSASTTILPFQKEAAARHWSSTDVDCGGDPVYSGGGMGESHFKMIKSLLEGGALKEAGNKYLPLFAERFAKDSSAV